MSALYETCCRSWRSWAGGAVLSGAELPLCRVLADVEIAGFLVDAKALSDFGEALQEATDRTEQAIYPAGGKFNINSPKQLGRCL